MLLLLSDPLRQAVLPVTTIGDFFAAGGLLMWPILLCSVVVVGLAIERYLCLRPSRVLPQPVFDAVDRVRQGQTEGAAAAVETVAAPAARVLAAGLRRRGHALQDIERAMEDQAQKEAARLRGNVRGIALMAALAPLLGLLGTVVGIAEAFATVEQTGLGKPENLAAGIKVALYTTIFGLCVAIPATVLAAHLHARVRAVLIGMAEALAPAVEPLAVRGQGGSHAA